MRAVVDRYEILRTTFQRPAGVKLPLQVIAASLLPHWREIDAGELDAAQLEAVLREERLARFDFERDSPLRLALVALLPDRHVLLITQPSLWADAFGLQNLVREIAQRYFALGRGEPDSDEPLQYADLAEWQQELLETEDEDGQAGRAFWQKPAMSGRAEPSLPFEATTDGAGEFETGCRLLPIDRALAARIAAVAAAEGASPGAFLLACWQTLIARLTGSADILLGYVSDGRKYEELQAPLGLFSRTLPLPGRYDGDRSFLAMLRQAAEAVREAVKWQEYYAPEEGPRGDPGGEADAGPERVRFPFCFEEGPPPACVAQGGLSFTVAGLSACAEPFKLRLSCAPAADGWMARLDYDLRRFTPEPIERLVEQFMTLVADAAARPDALAGRLALLPAAERQQLLVSLNETAGGAPDVRCFHELFAAQAAQTPDLPAVRFEDQELSYARLDYRANELAHRLRALGVGAEAPVAVCLERSLEMVIGLLGVLKAGGAFVPLDPLLPRDRLAFMLSDTRASVLLTQRSLLDQLPPSQAHIVCMDEGSTTAGAPAGPPQSGVTARNLAYVIYTSGSSGQPKGVGVEHRSLVRYVRSIAERLELKAGESFAMVSTFAADLGHTALFGALATGGCLHVISPQAIADPELYVAYARRHRIDGLKIVPSHLAALLAGSQPAAVLPHRRLVLGGEAASAELVRRARELAPECALYNHYGPTETTVGVLAGRPEREGEGSAKIALGRPLAGSRVYLLDPQGELAPFGVAGELYIGGEGVARGYLGRPDLTAERFLPDPFGGEPGARLYRTGDRARYREDGRLEFLGRMDRQVKLRGFRVEPGEIEAALRQHPSVREAVVVTAPSSARSAEGEVGALSPEERLVAYLVPAPGRAADAAELRDRLQQTLPDFMIPAAFVTLASLPLTANGKLDRAALPPPDGALADREEPLVGPRNAVEEIMAGIWAEVLGLEAIGVHDSFFERGGHSLLATRVVARVRNAFQVEVPLRSLFTAPTVAGLSSLMLENAAERPKIERTAQLLVSLAQLSDEEVESMLEQRAAAAPPTSGGRSGDGERR